MLSATLAFYLEIVSVGFALAYLALAIPQSLWCWPAALISTAVWMVVSFNAKLYMDAGLQVFYFAMGIYGWVQWRRGGAGHTGIEVHWWRLPMHAVTITLILLVSIGAGLAMSRSDAAFPYLDSFTTVAAIVATFMVTRKVIENWLYWFVIDSIYIYLYVERGLFGYAALYALYLVMIVFGFVAWQKNAHAVS